MSGLVIVGTQWGDEGKGKITNYYASSADMVVRFQGGANAGHTVSVNRQPVVFHLLPSGISVPGVRCVLGPGVAIDPEALVDEIDGVRSRGVEIGDNLFVDIGAPMVLPYHKAIEEAEEEARGSRAIGTTRRGIGPAYVDRYSRDAINIGELASFDDFRSRFEIEAGTKNLVLTKLYGREPLDVAAMLERIRSQAERLSPYLSDTPGMVRSALREGRNVLFEGAQGTLLDVVHGTYPYVTSSFTCAAGVASGAGVPPSSVDEVVGIAKAYTTRVGEGPFPTESFDADADLIRERGSEVGSTTGRPRRCGWLDAVALRYSIELNGIERLIVTKLDVLDAFETLRVCVAYDIDGKRTERFPRNVHELARAVPIYEDFPGWNAPTCDAREPDQLPTNATAYLKAMEDLCGAGVAAVSVGATAPAIVEFSHIF